MEDILFGSQGTVNQTTSCQQKLFDFYHTQSNSYLYYITAIKHGYIIL